MKDVGYYMDDVPILQGCLGTLVCNVQHVLSMGDHDVCFGNVERVVGSLGSSNGRIDPLLYYQSAYRSIGDEVFIDAFRHQRLSFRDWTHRAHLRFGWLM